MTPAHLDEKNGGGVLLSQGDAMHLFNYCPLVKQDGFKKKKKLDHSASGRKQTKRIPVGP